MDSLELVLLAGAFLAGFLVAWFWSSLRVQPQLREQGRIASHLEGEAKTLREQIEGLRRDAETSRTKIEEEQTRRAAAETAVSKTEENLAEQKRSLDEMKQRMSDAFGNLAADALQRSSESFLELARTKFEALQKEASGDLSKREEAIKGLVNPLATSLQDLDKKLSEVESSRKQDYGGLAEQLRKLTVTSEDLRKETGSLVTSLRQPQIKGKWGELLLRRALELTGMSPYCDFVEQPTTTTEDGRMRPDLIVKIPGGGIIVIDAKVPQGAFLNALSARSQEEYWAAMSEHARLVRNHVSHLAARKYWEQFPQSPEFVVLFLPAESFFSAALEQDRTLIEDAMDKRIILASPTTLLALLRTVAHGWHQEKIAEHALEISEIGKKLYERVLIFVEHMQRIGAGLERANKSFNEAVGSLEARVLPAARELKEKGIQAASEIPQAEPTQTALRSLSATSSEGGS